MKDEALVDVSTSRNVARFVSFGPSASVCRYAVLDAGPAAAFPGWSVLDAIERLFNAGALTSVNVRSFLPDRANGNPFVYGLQSATDAAAEVHRLTAEGFYTIVNETIPIDDGGVSGVVESGIVEFAPGDTPRAVEKPGITSLPHETAVVMLQQVYGTRIDLPATPGQRVEFSIHPLRVGTRQSHTLIWEVSSVPKQELDCRVRWPNKFSNLIGDKAFGLLLASSLGAPVPATTVVARGLAPFRFGQSTGTGEIWIRTAPFEQMPGLYSTQRGWTDPFTLLQREDPGGNAISSVLSQEGVDAAYSGATLPRPGQRYDYVEGVLGFGEDFMRGAQTPATLPVRVVEDVRELSDKLKKFLGPVRLEWVHDGRLVWLVQIHVSDYHQVGETVYPGVPENGWLTFNPQDGLELLSDLVKRADANSQGINVAGDVGLTSHVGDILRKARLPARILRDGSQA